MSIIRAYTSAVTKAYVRAVIPGGGGASFDAIAPSALTLTVIDDTSIKLDFTVNSTGQDGHSIERSTDGITYSEIATVSGTTATYTDTTGSDGTRYYYRVRAYKDTAYSAYCTAANDWCAIKMVLTSTGTGAGVSTVRFWFATTDVVATLDGNGKWYSDSGGTANESASYTFTAGSLQTRYLKVTSGTSNMLIFANGNLLRWGDHTGNGFISGTNAASVAKNISGLTSLAYISIGGNNTLSGSVAGLTNLTYLYVRGSNTLSGSVAGMTTLQVFYVEGLNTLSGSVAGLTSLVGITVTGSNTLSGDIGGSGTAAMVNGVIIIYLTGNNQMSEYTSGATWSLNDTSLINPATGYGYSATEIDNMLIDMAASLGTVSAKTITLKGSSAARTSASNAAVATLNGKGWTIVTN